MKTLNLSATQRLGCLVRYNLNKFYVYLADGCFVTSAIDKTDLKAQLAANKIQNAQFDAIAQCMYLG